MHVFSDIDPDFKMHLKTFVKSILSTEQLVVKKINGAGITGNQLYRYMKVNIFACLVKFIDLTLYNGLKTFANVVTMFIATSAAAAAAATVVVVVVAAAVAAAAVAAVAAVAAFTATTTTTTTTKTTTATSTSTSTNIFFFCCYYCC